MTRYGWRRGVAVAALVGGGALVAAFPRIARAEETVVAAEASRAGAQIDATLAAIAGRERFVRALLGSARESGDAARVVCTDDALSRVHAAFRTAREEARRAGEAYAAGDVEAARRAMARLARARMVTRVAAVDAGSSCDPRSTPEDDETVVTVQRASANPR